MIIRTGDGNEIEATPEEVAAFVKALERARSDAELAIRRLAQILEEKEEEEEE